MPQNADFMTETQSQFLENYTKSPAISEFSPKPAEAEPFLSENLSPDDNISGADSENSEMTTITDTTQNLVIKIPKSLSQIKPAHGSGAKTAPNTPLLKTPEPEPSFIPSSQPKKRAHKKSVSWGSISTYFFAVEAEQPVSQPPSVSSDWRTLLEKLLELKDKQDNYVDISFQLHYKTRFGEFLGIIGSAPCVGAWNPDNILRMHWTNGNLWRITHSFPKKELPFQFKFVVCSYKGENIVINRWEDSENRQCTQWRNMIYGDQDEWERPGAKDFNS